MKKEDLKNKKITLATLKSFIKKSESLFVLIESSFDGMIDGIRYETEKRIVKVSKENAIGHNGVWCVGSSRDYFRYFENENYFGIEVSNSCGCGILLTNK